MSPPDAVTIASYSTRALVAFVTYPIISAASILLIICKVLSACKAYQKGINLIQGIIAVGQCRVQLNIVQYGHLARVSRTFVVFDDHMIIITHDDLHPMVNGK